ncbi:MULTISPECIES: PadR family transcriptional regulator [unclassified Mycolicibacterium]|uniref:PadR family transcriptional regulator n=1 Tax=unclassified Mycolicibacterium TaxID=2636767 RepID=UPI00130CC4BD|nr:MULTISPECIES: PadR family transcriptional regulator [unclassified Mycolicibacterium]MUL84841.1 PadR family transcriptional regulator [Mycolicibacterium sp. CBMA 329]MUL90808.1 PadR family transcriptional regulator [Mycolicibacterium sp. CBMA 331]MUM01756.1 PadR family transcriptional regulator [Mycolicibacterium sp. CBMA 334]MUM30010.1 PadR family transcriptional regulator [Mycolicibacterium sp. CBMA 295]MUM40567.1 PadR family transcriptional regulator [Mycolicibacterium sp. CBMA 247]
MAGVAAPTVRLLVLGVVRALGEAHGYAVHRELMSWRVDTWTAVKPPSIYHAVKQLEREDQLRSVRSEAGSRGPARTVYSVTASGDAEFFRLLEAALVSPEIEELGAGIAFMCSLPRRRVAELLAQQLTASRGIGEELQAMKPQWPNPQQPPHSQHLLDLWSGMFGANAKWTEAMLGQVRAGEFRFADEA